MRCPKLTSIATALMWPVRRDLPIETGFRDEMPQPSVAGGVLSAGLACLLHKKSVRSRQSSPYMAESSRETSVAGSASLFARRLKLHVSTNRQAGPAIYSGAGVPRCCALRMGFMCERRRTRNRRPSFRPRCAICVHAAFFYRPVGVGGTRLGGLGVRHRPTARRVGRWPSICQRSAGKDYSGLPA